MTEWFLEWWWLIFGVSTYIAYFAWQTRKYRDEPSIARRILYALAPQAHPDYKYPSLRKREVFFSSPSSSPSSWPTRSIDLDGASDCFVQD
jgi:hypothetical protein